MKIIKKIQWLFLIYYVFSTVIALGQDKRSMSLVDRLNIPDLRDARISSDGKQLIFLLFESDWKENKQISHVWRINSSGTGLQQMTFGALGERNPEWAPDGKQIAFIAKRESAKTAQVFLIQNNGGEARQLTHHATDVSNITWSPDGAYIYFLASDEKSEKSKRTEETKDDVYGFEENFQQQHLWKVSVADQKEERITKGDYSIISYQLSRDGQKTTILRAKSPIREDADFREVWVMDIDGKNNRQITQNNFPENYAELSPDNSKVLFLADANEKNEYYYNTNIFVFSLSDGNVDMLLPDMPHEVERASWSVDGKAIYFTANMGVKNELFRVDLATEKLEQLTEGKHTVRSWDYEPQNDIHILSIVDPTNMGDVWMLSSRKNEKPKRITHVYDYLSQEFHLPLQEVIQWQGKDGVKVEGLLTYPINYEKGKTYPLVVQTHGGPRSSDQYGLGGWRVYIPTLAAMGYAVFAPNYRGSAGYGDKFLRDMVGAYFQQSHLDVMAGVDYLIDQGIVDGDRMVKMGWSAGGHMTNKIITHTDRFKAASSGAGAVNWVSMYGQSDTRIQRTPWFGGTPWQKDAPIDIFWQNSPLKDIWKVKTPTLILVGENDVRVPTPQSVELYRALKSNGVPTHLYIAPREPHGFQELRHRLFKMNVELDWFEKYAMNRVYTWEKPLGNEK